MNNNQIAKIIVQKIGDYVNSLDKRNLGLPMMDEVAVMQMEVMVENILDNLSSEVEIPAYF